MADNVALPATGRNAATDQVTYSGDTADVQLVRPVLVTGSEGSKTVVEAFQGDATDGLLVKAGAPGDVVDVTLSLDTSAYADGDVLADTQSFTGVRVSGGRAILQSVTVLDEDDVGQTFDLIFLSANNSLGTENSAPSITDANARDILGWVRVSSGDYIDLGGCKVASLRGLGLVLEAAGSTSLYVGAVIRGAGTYTASGLRLKLGLLWG